MPKKLTAVSFLVPRNHSEEAVSFLRETAGAEPAVISKTGMKLDRVILYFENDKKVASIQKTFQENFNFNYRVQIRTIQEEEWRDKWKENYRPFFLTKKIRVSPSWIKAKSHSPSLEIILDPGFAFGTGIHETTRFMARMLEKTAKRCRSFFDVGYGSGILSIVAAKIGFARIRGVDFDPNALAAAEENIKKNKVEEQIRLKCKDIKNYKAKKKFDFIGANVDSETLLENREKLYSLMHKGSYLCISGIGRKNRRKVHKAFKRLGLRCVRKSIGKEWCGFLYKKKKRSRTRKVREKVKSKVSSLIKRREKEKH